MEENKDLQNQEEEQLNLDELLNVQGGIENDEKGIANCGLGCYTGGLGTGSKDFNENENPKG